MIWGWARNSDSNFSNLLFLVPLSAKNTELHEVSHYFASTFFLHMRGRVPIVCTSASPGPEVPLLLRRSPRELSCPLCAVFALGCASPLFSLSNGSGQKRHCDDLG